MMQWVLESLGNGVEYEFDRYTAPLSSSVMHSISADGGLRYDNEVFDNRVPYRRMALDPYESVFRREVLRGTGRSDSGYVGGTENRISSALLDMSPAGARARRERSRLSRGSRDSPDRRPLDIYNSPGSDDGSPFSRDRSPVGRDRSPLSDGGSPMNLDGSPMRLDGSPMRTDDGAGESSTPVRGTPVRNSDADIDGSPGTDRIKRFRQNFNEGERRDRRVLSRHGSAALGLGGPRDRLLQAHGSNLQTYGSNLQTHGSRLQAHGSRSGHLSRHGTGLEAASNSRGENMNYLSDRATGAISAGGSQYSEAFLSAVSAAAAVAVSSGADTHRMRKIHRSPYKILDAPGLQDDFYLNLLDWGSNNVVAVGLGSAVFLWDALSGKASKLHDFSSDRTSLFEAGRVSNSVGSMAALGRSDDGRGRPSSLLGSSEAAHAGPAGGPSIAGPGMAGSGSVPVQPGQLGRTSGQGAGAHHHPTGRSSGGVAGGGGVAVGGGGRNLGPGGAGPGLGPGLASGSSPQAASPQSSEDLCTAVAWSSKGSQLATACGNGQVIILDATTGIRIRNLSGHRGRTGAIAWHGNVLATGGRDNCILVRDLRLPNRGSSGPIGPSNGPAFDSLGSGSVAGPLLGTAAFPIPFVPLGSLEPSGTNANGLDGPALNFGSAHGVSPSGLFSPAHGFGSQAPPPLSALISQGAVRVFAGHSQEVCGLKWSPDGSMLASGGNDNLLHVWSMAGKERGNGSGGAGNDVITSGSASGDGSGSARSSNHAHGSSAGLAGSSAGSSAAAQTHAPMLKLEGHLAAVKAIGWSWRSGVLASGGGTADRCIKFWDVNTGQMLNSIDTGSQVCNLAWSQTSNELVTTHGYSLNQIVVWKYPRLQKIATLAGHTYRVLYLSLSPDGQNIVTGAGDETLRFWNVFPKHKSRATSSTSSIAPMVMNVCDGLVTQAQKSSRGSSSGFHSSHQNSARGNTLVTQAGLQSSSGCSAFTSHSTTVR